MGAGPMPNCPAPETPVSIAPQDDLDRIMAVMEAAFDPAYGEAWTRSQVDGALVLGQTDYWLIAPDGGPVGDGPAAGFAMVRRVLDEAELLLFAVSPDYRRRGLGARLLGQVQQALRQYGVVELLLEMRRGNRAELLYCAHGFAPIGVRPRYYCAKDGTRHDAITFRCALDATKA